MTDPLVLDERLLGAIPSPPDVRDWQLGPLLAAAAMPLAPRFTARLLGPVLNQGNTGRCVAFSGTGLRQQQERSDGDWSSGWPSLDAQWLYDHAQAIDGLGPPSPQRGTTIRAAVQVLARQGQPLTGDPASAARFRIASYTAVPRTVEAIKRALLQFGPVWIATAWYRPWFRPVSGILPAPSGAVIGGHARFIWGWDDNVAGGAFLVRNSWGVRWGVNGNSYDPYGPLVANLWECWSTADVLHDFALTKAGSNA